MEQEKRPASKAQQKAQNKWIANTYDRINLTVDKGYRATIKAYADMSGESVNGFINRAIKSIINGVQPTESPVSASALLVVSDDIARVNAHIEATGETTGEFIHRAIGDTIDRDAALLKMGISPAKKKNGE